MKPAHRPTNRNLIPGGPGQREGRRQRIVRRMLIAADGQPVTTWDLVEAIYPRGPWLSWHWSMGC